MEIFNILHKGIHTPIGGYQNKHNVNLELESLFQKLNNYADTQSLDIYLNPGAAGCGIFAAKRLLAHFKTFSQSINSKSELCKLLTCPALEFDDKVFFRNNTSGL